MGQTHRTHARRRVVTRSIINHDDFKWLMRLQRITELASGLGLSLQGVEHVLALEDRVQQLEQQVADLGAALDEAARVMQTEVESVHRSYRHEIVPYIPPPGAELVLRRRRMR